MDAIKIPSFDELIRLAPLVSLILLLVIAGVGISWFFITKHLDDLRSFVEYLKDKNK